MATRRCVIYARISVSAEASVSVERQIEAARQYAASRDWQVVGTFVDDGVSATHNKPEDRAGWRALLASPERYDAVIVWKVDRLARRISDFWSSYERLQSDGRSLASVMDNLDMTSTIGQIVAGVIAGFAQMEAEAISSRVRAARTHLLNARRVAGGTVPYGWQSLPNPDGPGLVLAQDPTRIDYVRGMAERAQRGNSIYSVVQWLDEAGAPTPTGRGTWAYSTVERILRHPVLAGMTPFNPYSGPPKQQPGETPEAFEKRKRREAKQRGTGVLRDGDGLPVVDESVAIMPVASWRALVAGLDDRTTGHSKPRALRTKTSALLSRLVWCGHCEARMHRCALGPTRHGYTCPGCSQTITNFEPVVIEEFLRQKGERVRWTRVEQVVEGGAALLPEIEHRLDELDMLIRQATDREQRRALQDEQSNLLDLRDAKRDEISQVSLHYDDAG